MLIEDIIRQASDKYGSKIALRRGRFHIQFNELERASNTVAARLRQSLPDRGHIGILTGNRIEYAVAYFGITKAGGVIVPFASATYNERVHCEADFCDVDYILGTPDLAAEKCLTGWCVPEDRFDQDWGGGGLVLFRVTEFNHERLAKQSDLQTAILLATSGTLRAPRRVALSHSNVTGNMLAFVDGAGLRLDDRALIALPLVTVGTNTTELLTYLHCGITATIYPHPAFSLFNYCSMAQAESTTVANVTPFILKLMIQHRADIGSTLGQMRKWFFASSPLGSRTALQLAENFPTMEFCYGYGLTEASPRCTMLPVSQFRARPGSAGKPLPGVRVEIIHEDGLISPDGFGEIVVKGPNVMQGYYKKPEETANVLRDGWLCTGDLGHFDREGFLYVDGRKDNLILCRGVSICPEEIEEVILQHPAVADAVATGVPDELTFQRVIAHVVVRPAWTLSESQLLSFLAVRLDSVKCPSQVRFVPELVRNEGHKLMHRFAEETYIENGVLLASACGKE